MLEEDDRVLAADGGAEEAVGVERGGRADHPEPGHAGEDGRAGLGVIDRPALEVPAVGDAHHDRRR